MSEHFVELPQQTSSTYTGDHGEHLADAQHVAGRFTSSGVIPPVAKTNGAVHPTASDKAFGAHTLEQAMRSLVADVEARAKTLATQPAHFTTMLEAADAIAQHFAATTSQIPKVGASLFVTELQRIESAMSILFQLGRRGHLRMRESHLEQAFKKEDDLRVKLGATVLDRADHYYDEASTESADRVPSVGDLHDELVGGAGHEPEKPTRKESRQDLIRTICGFARELGHAIDLGFHAAAAIIKEPPPPKRPDMLDALAEIAAGFILGGANGALGKLIGDGFKHIATAANLEEHVGDQVSELLVDTFKDATKHGTKEAITSGGAVALDRANPHPERKPEGDTVLDNPKLTPKSIYIERARGLAAKAIGATEAGFVKLDGELRRQPTETLAALSKGFGPAVKAQVKEAFAQVVVREWVNFSKDVADRTPSSTQLNMDKGRVGVVDIRLEAKGSFRSQHARNNKLTDLYFGSAKVHGIDPAVVDNLKNQPYTLATLPLARKIQIHAENGAIAEFQIDRLGMPSFLYPHLSASARDLLALVGKTPIAANEEPTEGHAWAGIHATIATLSRLSAYRIEGDE